MQVARSAIAVVTRDRLVVGATVTLLTLLAWSYLLWLSSGMSMSPMIPSGATSAPSGGMGDLGGMPSMDMPSQPGGGMADMPGMAGMSMAAPAALAAAGPLAPALRIWAPADLAFTFAMWTVMMIGMMTPSVTPMLLLYAAAGRAASRGGRPLAATGWFLSGYLVVWVGFSALATLAQWALTAMALMTPMMATTSAVLGGVLLIAIGLYQWTPLKWACLRACQSPLGFLAEHGGFSPQPLSAVRLGFAHGVYCLGCCAALMILLFVGGIMNLLWIAGLTILVLLEKVMPGGRLLSRVSGAVIAVAGVWMLATAFRAW